MDTKDTIIQALLGKPVNIVVDRPVGYCHNGTVYPVNYGYVPGVIAADGEEQDAYILGVSQPLTVFDGWVIGCIRRKDDCEDKLIVAPEGMYFHQAQIAEAVRFQEQYFDSTVISLFRKSCGVIPYREQAGQREYLLLLQTGMSWSFPKGHMEPGETEEETALRELYEETNLTAKLVPGASVVTEYHIPPQTRKQVVLFLGEVHGDIRLQPTEIASFRWVKRHELQEYLHPNTYAACAPLLPDDTQTGLS